MFLFKTRQLTQLEGQRINLRSLVKGDFKLIHSWLEDHELMELAFGMANSQLSFYNLLPAYKKEIEENADSFFAIETKSFEMIGFCSQTLFNPEKRARIGVLIGTRLYWNQGLGREAVMLLLRHLFFDKKMRTIELDTATTNTRAQRCFESCGFEIIHKDWCQANERLWYELDRDRFLAYLGRRR